VSFLSTFSKNDTSEDRKQNTIAYLQSHWDVLDGDLQIDCLPAEPDQGITGHTLDRIPSHPDIIHNTRCPLGGHENPPLPNITPPSMPGKTGGGMLPGPGNSVSLGVIAEPCMKTVAELCT
jgi:hypothetical protein